MIADAFQDQWWSRAGRYAISGGVWSPSPTGYSQMEANFSMFWGLAILAYESTLVSAPLAGTALTADNSEFDRRQARGVTAPTGAPIPGGLSMRTAFGGPTPGGCTVISESGLPNLTADEELLQRGCTIFARNSGVQGSADGIRGGGCFACHNAQGGGASRNPAVGPDGVTRSTHPMLSENTTSLPNEPFGLFLTVADAGVRDADGAIIRAARADLRDNGTANIGLRPVLSDLMMGAADPYKNPLSLGRQLENYYRALAAGDPSPISKILDPKLKRAVLAGPPAVPTQAAYNGKLEVDGATKTPLLRNIALTPPYFSWGGYPSLRQLLKVYNRGMNSRTIPFKNTTPANPVNNNNGREAGAIASNCSSGDNSGTGVKGYPPLDASGNPSPGLTGAQQRLPDGTDPGQAGACDTNITGVIRPLGLVDCDAPGACPVTRGGVTISDAAHDDLAALERFLLSLTDRRVQCSKAPFDHPSLIVTNGHVPTNHNPGKPAPDITFELPAIGAGGYPINSGFCIPGDASAIVSGGIPPAASSGLFTTGMQATSGGARASALQPPVGPTP